MCWCIFSLSLFQQCLNKCNGNIFLIKISLTFPSAAPKFFVPTSVIEEKDPGDEYKFCTILMDKTVGRIGIINSYFNSDQFSFQFRGASHVLAGWARGSGRGGTTNN